MLGRLKLQDLVRELYVRHFNEGSRLAYLLTGDPILAEDVAQDAFIKAAGKLRTLQSTHAFWPYYRVAILNRIRDEARRNARQRSHSTWIASVPSSESRIVESEYLWDRLSRLKDRQRTVIVLRYYEDLTDEQIATMLKCSRATVRSLAMRGLQALRVSIGEDDG